MFSIFTTCEGDVQWILRIQSILNTCWLPGTPPPGLHAAPSRWQRKWTFKTPHKQPIKIRATALGKTFPETEGGTPLLHFIFILISNHCSINVAVYSRLISVFIVHWKLWLCKYFMAVSDNVLQQWPRGGMLLSQVLQEIDKSKAAAPAVPSAHNGGRPAMMQSDLHHWSSPSSRKKGKRTVGFMWSSWKV